MKKQIIINGKKQEARVYKTRRAADNFIKKHPEYSTAFARAHEYYLVKTESMNLFTLHDNEFGARFTFHAVDAEGALDKAKDWARYHSFEMSSVFVMDPTDAQRDWPSHNEYVN